MTTRYFGLWRPFGFSKNRYQLFYTKSPIAHFTALHNRQAKYMKNNKDLKDLIDYYVPWPEVVVYSSRSYLNYDKLYHKYVQYLGHQDPYNSYLIREGKPLDGIRRFNFVEFKGTYFPNIDQDLLRLQNNK
jgi:hypothetical protein